MSLDRNYNIKVDIRKGSIYFNSLKCYTTDENINNITVKFIDDNKSFDLTGCTIFCNIKKPNDKKVVEQVIVTDFNNGIAELTLSKSSTSIKGIHKAEFLISRDGDITTTDTFRYSVSSSIEGEIDEEIVDTSDYNILIKLLDTVRDLETFVEEKENIRQSNEDVRVKQELDRQKSISNLENKANNKINEMNISKNEMVSNVTNKITEVDTAKQTMVSTVNNKVTEINTSIDNMESRFNSLSPEQATNAEVQLARTDAEGVTHNSLHDRLLKAETRGNILFETVEG